MITYQCVINSPMIGSLFNLLPTEVYSFVQAFNLLI